MKAATIATALGGHPSSGGWHRARCQVHQSGGETLTLMDVPEGVESALAASELLRCPAWAVLSAGGIKQVICTQGRAAIAQARSGATAPAPLFTTDDDFVTATQKLVAHKALAPDEDDDQVNEGRAP